MILAECFGEVRSITDLRKFQQMLIETRILEEVYYPLWYFFSAALSRTEQNGSFFLATNQGTWDEIKVELIPDKDNPEGDTIKACLFEIHDAPGGDRYTVGIKCKDTQNADYTITIDCPHQGIGGDVFRAISNPATSYSDIARIVDDMAAFVSRISNRRGWDAEIKRYALVEDDDDEL